MRIAILCIGRARAGPARSLYDDYAGRLPWPLTLKEMEERRPLPVPQRMRREAELLRAAIPAGALTVALDERGRTLSSQDFARRLGAWAADGVPDLAFLIGGADGLAPEIRDTASLVVSLGPMTWPHMLVRVLLAEQLYRASTILSGHPYHRE